MGLFGNNLFANAATTANNTAVENTPKTEPQQTAPEPQPQQTTEQPKAVEPQTAPTAPVVKEKYVAPQSATEAKQRIEAAIEAGRVKQVPSSEDGQLQFVGKTFALQQAFRMLGGSFDKSASIWSVPATHWQNPEQCADLVQTELGKQAKRDESREAFEKRVNEAVEKRIEAERKKWEKEHTASAAEGMISIEQAKKNTLAALKNLLAQMGSMKDESLMKNVEKVFAA